MKAAVQCPPREVGIDLADWNWKVVHAFLEARYGVALGASSCHTYLHRLGFVLKRPRKRLLKADAAKREAFVGAYAALREEAEERSGPAHMTGDVFGYMSSGISASVC